MGQEIGHLDDLVIEQEWSYLASKAPHVAGLRSERSDGLELDVPKAQPMADDSKEEEEIFGLAKVEKEAAEATAAAAKEAARRKEDEEMNKDIRWKVHLVKLASNAHEEEKRQALASRARRQLRRSATRRREVSPPLLLQGTNLQFTQGHQFKWLGWSGGCST